MVAAFEFGLASRHYLKHSHCDYLGWLLWRWGCYQKTDGNDSHSIKGIDQLKTILERAKELEAEK